MTKVPTDTYDGCLCPGHVVMYECTVNVTANLASITWKGSALSCSSTDNEIHFLLHRNLSQDIRSCSDGSITGKIIRADDNETYTSQLNVTLTNEIAGKSIKCVLDNGQSELIAGSLIIPDGE